MYEDRQHKCVSTLMTILDRVITRYEGIFYKGEKYQKVKTNDALAKEKKKD